VVTNETIKEDIRDTIVQIEQWHDMGIISNYAEHVIKLEILVEILEVDNCGSVGGFDKGQKYEGSCITALYNRAGWVLNK